MKHCQMRFPSLVMGQVLCGAQRVEAHLLRKVYLPELVTILDSNKALDVTRSGRYFQGNSGGGVIFQVLLAKVCHCESRVARDEAIYCIAKAEIAGGTVPAESGIAGHP